MVYDTVNHVTWLADFNLPAKKLPDGDNLRFSLPLCHGTDSDPTLCIFASGAMNYTSARTWIDRLNKANYLGHGDWQLPSAPLKDHYCSGTGPGPYFEGFAFNCEAGALAHLYLALGLRAPETAVPIPPNTVGPFINFQPNRYWSNSPGGSSDSLGCTIANFSFASGAQGGGCGGDFADLLPMIDGEEHDVTVPSGTDLYVNLDGKTVYDPATKVTWLLDANLAANWLADTDPPMDTLGLPLCQTAPDKTPCVAKDGSMNYESAVQFIKNMNAYIDPVTGDVGYLKQKKWEFPPVPANCPLFNCSRVKNPMGELFYKRLGKHAGEPVVDVPDIAVGPFIHLQPFPYWSCLADTIQDFCDTEANEPSTDSEWGFSFQTGYQGTARLSAYHFVTAYFQGCDLSSCQTITFDPIAAKDALTSFTLSATASSGLAVSFNSTTPKECKVSGNTASLLFPGKCTIVASQPGDDSFYSALPIQRTITVDRAIQTIKFPPIPTQKPGVTVLLKATAGSGLPVTYSASSSPDIGQSTNPPKVCEVLYDAVLTISAGTCSVGAYQAGDDLYAPASAARSFKVKAQ